MQGRSNWGTTPQRKALANGSSRISEGSVEVSNPFSPRAPSTAQPGTYIIAFAAGVLTDAFAIGPIIGPHAFKAVAIGKHAKALAAAPAILPLALIDLKNSRRGKRI